eukprot:3999042-Amphidinium_carterae.1
MLASQMGVGRAFAKRVHASCMRVIRCSGSTRKMGISSSTKLVRSAHPPAQVCQKYYSRTTPTNNSKMTASGQDHLACLVELSSRSCLSHLLPTYLHNSPPKLGVPSPLKVL